MPQAGGGAPTLIESNDRRALDAVWRDNALWLTTTINPNSGTDSGQTTALWVKIDTSNLAGLTLADSGTIGGEDIASGAYTTFPSIAVNANEDVVVGFSASASTIFVGAYFVDRQAGDSAGTMGNAVTVKAGVAKYKRTFGGSRNRWGDYSSATLDPLDGCFWVYNKWADTQGTSISGETGRWGTAYVKTCATGSPGICNGAYHVDAGKWTRFSLPCSVAPGNTVQAVFGGANADDLDPDDYGDLWGIFRWDAATQAYVLLALTDTMLEGVGYWIFSTTATQLNIRGTPLANNDVALVGVHPAGRLNYLGYNLNATIDWDQVQVVDGETVFSFGEYDQLNGGDFDCDTPVQAACVMSRKMYKWNGNAYEVFDGITVGSEGQISPFDSFWVRAFKPGIKLRYPGGGGGSLTSIAPAAPSPWWLFFD